MGNKRAKVKNFQEPSEVKRIAAEAMLIKAKALESQVAQTYFTLDPPSDPDGALFWKLKRQQYLNALLGSTTETSKLRDSHAHSSGDEHTEEDIQ